MIWLVPAAWLGALALAVPILVHLVARPRPDVQPFPTLRFLPDAARTSRRRRRLEDWPLLAVRSGIVVAAVAALAGPLLVTPARRAAWNARVIRETVDARDGSARSGLARAVAALAEAPPGRRAIVVRSSFRIGSITDADIAAVPPSIGLTFERTIALRLSREVVAPALVRSAEASRSSGAAAMEREALAERLPISAERLSRRVVVDRERTSVLDGERTPDSFTALDLPSAARSALDAVLAERVPVVPPGHRARLFLVDGAASAAAARDAAPVRTPWIADAIARIARDADVRAAARQLTVSLPEVVFDRAPWHVVAENRDGRPNAAASADASERLVVAVASGPDQLATAVVIRSVLNAMAPLPTFDTAEVVGISDAQLRTWSRDPGEAAPPRRETVDADDRRALWIAVLILMGVETWMRRQPR